MQSQGVVNKIWHRTCNCKGWFTKQLWNNKGNLFLGGLLPRQVRHNVNNEFTYNSDNGGGGGSGGSGGSGGGDDDNNDDDDFLSDNLKSPIKLLWLASDAFFYSLNIFMHFGSSTREMQSL